MPETALWVLPAVVKISRTEPDLAAVLPNKTFGKVGRHK